MSSESRGLNLMNAEHVALLAYMQQYIRSITKEGKRPGQVIVVESTDTGARRKT